MTGQLAKTKGSLTYRNLYFCEVQSGNKFCVPQNSSGIAACGILPACSDEVFYKETCYEPVPDSPMTLLGMDLPLGIAVVVGIPLVLLAAGVSFLCYLRKRRGVRSLEAPRVSYNANVSNLEAKTPVPISPPKPALLKSTPPPLKPRPESISSTPLNLVSSTRPLDSNTPPILKPRLVVSSRNSELLSTLPMTQEVKPKLAPRPINRQ